MSWQPHESRTLHWIQHMVSYFPLCSRSHKPCLQLTLTYIHHSVHHLLLAFYSSLFQICTCISAPLVYSKRYQVPSFIEIMSPYCLCVSYFVWQHSKVDCTNGRCITAYYFNTGVSQFTPLSPLKSSHNSL